MLKKQFCLFTLLLFFVIQLNAIDPDELDIDLEEFVDLGTKIDLNPRIIKKEAFSEIIKIPTHGTFVMYYAPWCGHCKRMLSTWNELAQRHNVQKKFLIGKVDCTIETEFCSDNDILGYPTFIFYKNNNPNGQRYEGLRDTEHMENFMFNQIDFENIKEKIDVDLSESIDALNVLTEKNFDQFISKGFHFVKFFAPWCGHCNLMKQTWIELANKYSNRNVKISEVDCTQHGSVCNENGVKGYPTLMFFHDGKFIENYRSERSIEAFSNFLDKILKNFDKETKETDLKEGDESVEKVLDYNPEPGKVANLNDQTFSSVLKRPGFLFVKYYAPWCSHCQLMSAAWEEFATNHNPNVIIAEVDCTVSSKLCQTNQVRAYPSLFLYKNGNKIAEYEGLRNVEGFSTFLEKHLKHDEL